MVTALAFDVFGTLFDVSALQKVAGRFVGDAEGLVAFWRRKQLEYTFLLSQMGRFLTFSEITRRALEYVARRVDADLEPAQVDALLRAWEELPAYPDVLPALRAWKARYVLVVLSNGETALLEKLLRHSGLASFFTDVLSAEAVGTYKPSPKVYGLAVTRLGRPPEEIGLVSSNSFDIVGAKGAGLRAFWINRDRSVLDPLDAQPDEEAGDLYELMKRL